jgi:NAD(P)H-hydrate epimerase
MGTPITRDFVAPLFPSRPREAHKGAFGRTVVIAGSDRFIGAAILATRSALRSGVGLCTLASVPRVVNVAAVCAPEAVFIDLAEDTAVLAPALDNAASIVCGMGIAEDGRAARILSFLAYHRRTAPCPLILDAGALNLLAGDKGLRLLFSRRSPVFPLILTPHSGEMARLLGTPVGTGEDAREQAALTLAREMDALVVLKGRGTIIADREGRTMINTTGNPGLAKGGSGDVLAGIIAGLCGRGIAPFEAACAGVFLHGLAGDIAAKALTEEGMLPSDVIEALPGAFKELLERTN